MNILHIIRSVNPADGGPIEGIKQLGTTLMGAGHSVEIASLDPPAAPFVKNSPLPVHPLGPTVSKYGFSRRLIPWLRANHLKYDCVVLNGLWQFHGFGTWLALHKTDTPYVVYTHGMLDPWFRRRYPLKHFKKWLYWPWAEYRVVRDAKAVLFTCEEERLRARKSFWLYRCNEVVVGYGTATPQGDPAAEMQKFFGKYGHLRDKKLVLFMGRIHPKKGCDLLIEAFASVLKREEDCHLVMAGPDQTGWQGSLRQRAAQLGLTSRITWTGMLSGKMKWGALRAADVFVLPSHQENFGIAVAEALAVGLPTLISDKVNIWREVDADRAGIVGEDTLDGTCRMLLSYLAMSEENKRVMRRCARSCFEQRFEIKKAAANLETILSSVTG